VSEFIRNDFYIAGNKLNDNVNVGAYGWRHPHWLGEFYHEDLPQEWQLDYYSNVFNCVMVPADYWRSELGYVCESWLDDVHEDFVFYLELPADLLSRNAKEKYLQQITTLQPQLAGLVINDSNLPTDRQWLQSLAAIAPLYLSDLSDIDEQIFRELPVYAVWTDNLLHKGETDESSVTVSTLAILHDDLTDLRQCRQLLEGYFSTINSEQSQLPCLIIVRHAELSTSRLSQLRGVIEIMGF